MLSRYSFGSNLLFSLFQVVVFHIASVLYLIFQPFGLNNHYSCHNTSETLSLKSHRQAEPSYLRNNDHERQLRQHQDNSLDKLPTRLMYEYLNGWLAHPIEVSQALKVIV